MTFHDTQLNDEIERGAQGGPEFKTTILELSSGFEQRNIDWEYPKLSWDIGYGLRDKTDAEEVLAFFYARQGRAHTFRFKDWTDFEVGTSSTSTPQEIAQGTGSQTEFQIVRRYSGGASITFDRPITRPVSGTVEVYIDTGGGYVLDGSATVDLTTGVVTPSSTPGASDLIGVICQFDVPTRFDTDKLDLRAFWAGNYAIPQIPIKEDREELATLAGA